MNKLEKAQQLIEPQQTTLIAKGERLRKAVGFLQWLDPTLAPLTRQRWQGELVGNVIETKDVMTLAQEQALAARWVVIPFDKLAEWACAQGYRSLAELKEDYRLTPLDESDCTIEVACDPERTDLIAAFAEGGISNLKKYLETRGEKIVTDTPGVAEYFFGPELLLKLSGSLEALPKSFAPVIVGIVSSGDSLKEEGWCRLAEKFPKAVLLRSQLMLVLKKDSIKKEVACP